MSTVPESSAPTSAGRPSRTGPVWIVLVVAGSLLLLSSFAVWVDRVALNTDVFVDTSTELIENDAIRKAVATRAVDELFGSVDVETELEGQLPGDLKSLAGPATAGLRQASYTVVERALEQPVLQRLWALSLEQSHRTLIRVLEGDGRTISTREGVVTLELDQIVLEAADRIGIRGRIEDKLPEDVGRIEVLRSDELDIAQDAFQVLETLAWVLPLLTLGAFGLAVGIAGNRRRAVRRIGVTVLVVGVLGLVAVNLVGNYLVGSLVTAAENRAAAENAWDILTDLLRTSFRWQLAIGALFLVAAWLAGPGRRAMALRGALAPALRERAWAYAGLAALGLILLVTGQVGDFTRFLIIVVFLALGATWIELMRSRTMREFPDASGLVLLTDARARVSGWWETLRRASGARTGAPGARVDVTARLARLADLHARGELSDEEYAVAKARVLAGE